MANQPRSNVYATVGLQKLKVRTSDSQRGCLGSIPPSTTVPGPITAHRPGTVEAYRTSVERVIGYMKAYLHEPLDLEQLAVIAATSKFHLVRVFDELTGTTPHHFLACLRMQRAKELLLLSGASITEICFEVGYSSLGTFSKTFRSLVGIAPQEFRAMPKRINIKQFAMAVWRYLSADQAIARPLLEGTIESVDAARGFIFVGAFNGGVPQGAPFSGTVLVKPGPFRIERPSISEFHLLAVLIPFSAKLPAMIANPPVSLVASLRVDNADPGAALKPRLQLRPLRLTDPPIVLALPALPPWRHGFVH